jgi:hypothetical protein
MLGVGSYRAAVARAMGVGGWECGGLVFLGSESDIRGLMWQGSSEEFEDEGGAFLAVGVDFVVVDD